MKKRIALHNLGCKVNAYELDEIAGALLAHGYEIVPFSDDADVYIVNTCTVTNIADRKSRQMLHRAKKQNPEALVIALGCYVDTDPAGVKKDDCIDIALGNRDKSRLADLLEDYVKGAGKDGPVNRESEKKPQDKGQKRYRSRTRTYLKIQDGCNLFCSYCVIPYARGRSVSRPAEEVIREAEAVALRGVKEVVLTGIHISSYGLDFTKQRETAGTGALTDLIRRINEIKGIERIRLGSLEPRMITPETVHALLEADKLCPHFHLSLQSGCDTVLKRMRRRYTTAEYEESIALLRQVFDNPAITTDVIVGFPGETEAEFETGRRFVEKMDFYETHVFPFSARRGTGAATMEGQLTQKEKAARADVLLAMTAAHAKSYRARFLGKQLRVLWEEEEMIDGRRYLTGHTERYVKVAMPVRGEAGASLVNGSATGVYPGEISDVYAGAFLTEEVLFPGVAPE